MNREEYIAFHKDFCDRARELSIRKNNDYAGKSGSDPFANFRLCEAMGLCSTATGMLVRLSDKMCRIATFCASGELEVKSESVEDTLIDLVNYSALLAAVLKSKS